MNGIGKDVKRFTRGSSNTNFVTKLTHLHIILTGYYIILQQDFYIGFSFYFLPKIHIDTYLRVPKKRLVVACFSQQ